MTPLKQPGAPALWKVCSLPERKGIPSAVCLSESAGADMLGFLMNTTPCSGQAVTTVLTSKWPEEMGATFYIEIKENL